MIFSSFPNVFFVFWSEIFETSKNGAFKFAFNLYFAAGFY